jgi:RES domain-containing protein
VRAWRITRRAYQALDDEGARLNGGRWNSEGVPVVYTSATLSLAALEYLVHVEIQGVPDDLVSLEIEVPDGVPVQGVSPADLPDDWNPHGMPNRNRRMDLRGAAPGNMNAASGFIQNIHRYAPFTL